MVIIKKGKNEFRMLENKFMTAQDTSDGMYFKFTDGSELRLKMEVTNDVKAVSQILMNSPAENITIDFDKKPIITIG
jgi:hypothetical protein